LACILLFCSSALRLFFFFLVLQLEWEKQRKEVEHRRLQQLEREEAELLERLRNTQVLQQEAMRTQAMNGLQ
jgi:hypothetical protein